MKHSIALALLSIAAGGISVPGRAQSIPTVAGTPAQLSGNGTQSSSFPILDASKVSGATAAPSVATNTIAPLNGPNNTGIDLRKAIGKVKKPSASAAGVWKWTTFNRSLQPMENVLTLSVDKKGNVTGTLLDRTGLHTIENATLGTDTVTFDIKYHTRGVGDLPHNFTVNLDPDNPGVSVDRPDLTPFGKAHGGKHHSDHPAKHD